MTIQIDDAGWGCLVGGVLIGAYRKETGEFKFGEIPVEQFQGRAFADKAYLQGAREAARDLFAQLAVTNDEPVEICTGYVLEAVREWLTGEGYHWRAVKIEGELQILVETALLERLSALGLRNLDYETLTQKQGLAFWKCLRWLKGGNVEAAAPLRTREQFAKTGWSTYSIWANHPYQQAKALVKDRKRNGFREVEQG